MFAGHYGVSLAARKLNDSIPLWALFLAVQWLDVVWAPLVPFGVEKVRIVPGFTATNPLDLYYMPYTHSRVAALPGRSLRLGAIGIYLGASHPRRLAILVFGLAMLAIQTYVFFGPPPASSSSAAATALGAYLIFAHVIWFLGDRAPRTEATR